MCIQWTRATYIFGHNTTI